MNRKVSTLAAAAVVLGGLMLIAGRQSSGIVVDRALVTQTNFASGINGNVPSVEYDNNRLYTMIVLPVSWNSDQKSQEVMRVFGSDAVVRGSSIVRVHVADQLFQERWGNSFVWANNGTPTVAIFKEQGASAKSLYVKPMTARTDLSEQLARCQDILNTNCPSCPKPNLPFGPKPAPTTPPTQPTLPPLDTTPDDEDDDDDEEADENFGLWLIAGLAILGGAAAYYSRD